MNPHLDTFWTRATRSAFVRETQVGRQVAYLRSFDDHLLADIGLNRSDIEAYVRSRFEAKAGRTERGLDNPSRRHDTSPLRSPVVEVALSGAANLVLVALFALYPARWLGLW
jgi:uncharacterized protein YjiS (DUF1127 family)